MFKLLDRPLDHFLTVVTHGKETSYIYPLGDDAVE